MNKITETIKNVLSVLLEGRLEDVKAKYGENMSNIIDNLSQGDPSGNNKYLDWMAKVYQGNPMTNEIIDVVNKYHENLQRLTSEISTPIVDSNKGDFPGKAERRVKNNPKDINGYPSYKSLKLVVDNLEKTRKKRPDRDKIYQDSKFTVIVPKTHEAACKYGVHSNWCVSTSNSSYFGSYTTKRKRLLFFILWRNKFDTGDVVEYKMAANPAYEQWNDPYSWQWYTKNDLSVEGELALNIFPPVLIETIQKYLKDEGFKKGFLYDVESVIKEVQETENVIAESDDMIYFKSNDYTKYEKLNGYDTVSSRLNNNNNGRDRESWGWFFSINKKNGYISHNMFSKDYIFKYNKWLNNFNDIIDFIPFVLGLNKDTIVRDDILQSMETNIKNILEETDGGWFSIRSNKLSVGDKIRWKKGKGYWRQLHSEWNEAFIDRQTPSGFFVTRGTREFPKGKRFKPTNSKYFDKWVEFENVNLKKHN